MVELQPSGCWTANSWLSDPRIPPAFAACSPATSMSKYINGVVSGIGTLLRMIFTAKECDFIITSSVPASKENSAVVALFCFTSSDSCTPGSIVNKSRLWLAKTSTLLMKVAEHLSQPSGDVAVATTAKSASSGRAPGGSSTMGTRPTTWTSNHSPAELTQCGSPNAPATWLRL